MSEAEKVEAAIMNISANEAGYPFTLRKEAAALAKQAVERVERERDSLMDAFLSTGGLWRQCDVCGFGSLVRLGEIRESEPGQLNKHVCGACVAAELRARIASLESERDRLRFGAKNAASIIDKLEAANAKLQAEVDDADLLLGDSWQQVVETARGEAGVEAALRTQCVKLSGDVAELRAANAKLVEERDAALACLRRCGVAASDLLENHGGITEQAQHAVDNPLEADRLVNDRIAELECSVAQQSATIAATWTALGLQTTDQAKGMTLPEFAEVLRDAKLVAERRGFPMPDLTQAKEAAERRIKSDYRDTLGELPSLTVELALVSLLRSPADYLDELLEAPHWIPHERKPLAILITPVGTYEVREWSGDLKGWWYFPPDAYHKPCDSLEHGKQLCWLDYKARMAGAFRKG